MRLMCSILKVPNLLIYNYRMHNFHAIVAKKNYVCKRMAGNMFIFAQNTSVYVKYDYFRLNH